MKTTWGTDHLTDTLLLPGGLSQSVQRAITAILMPPLRVLVSR